MKSAKPTPNVYDELLAEAPPAIHRTLQLAADGVAAMAWIREGTTPEGTAPSGKHPQRRFLTRTGTDHDERRWVEWENERYDDSGEDVSELEDAVAIPGATICHRLDISEPTPFYCAMAHVLDCNDGSDEALFETTPAGTLYAVLEISDDDGPTIYRGIWRLHNDLTLSELPQPAHDERVRLNDAAEHVLARALW